MQIGNLRAYQPSWHSLFGDHVTNQVLATEPRNFGLHAQISSHNYFIDWPKKTQSDRILGSIDLKQLKYQLEKVNGHVTERHNVV